MDNGTRELKEARRILLEEMRLTTDPAKMGWLKNVIDLIEEALIKRAS